MRTLHTLVTGVAAAALALAGQAPAHAAAPSAPPTYYVSLGDSLAQGYTDDSVPRTLRRVLV